MKRHRFDVLSFIAGVIVACIGLAFLLPAEPTDIFTILDDFGAWFWPVVLLLVGIAILAPLAGRESDESPDENADL